jgi:hygromycin-B 7''-O-kinase
LRASWLVRGRCAPPGYGPCGQAWADRLAIYRLYHALELWDWFASIGQTRPLGGLAGDMRVLITAR